MCQIRGSHNDEYEGYGFLGYDACTAVNIHKPLCARLHGAITGFRNLNNFKSILADVCKLYAASLKRSAKCCTDTLTLVTLLYL
jgi:hypothetical protein